MSQTQKPTPQTTTDPASVGDGARRLPRLSLLLIPLAAALLHAPSIGHDFTGWDDDAYITRNTMLDDVVGLWDIWTSRDNEQYYPVTFTSYWIEYRIFGKDPLGYHATNVILHALNTLLLLWLLRALQLPHWVTCVAGLLFALHPVQVMSVAWVAERKNLLSTLFSLLAMRSWVKHAACGCPRYYLFALAGFSAALLSKTAVLTLPAAFVAMDVFLLRRPLRGSLIRAIPLLALSIAAAAVTVLFEQKFIPPAYDPSLGVRPMIIAAALWFYVRQLIAPIQLLPIYPRWDITVEQAAWWLPLLAAIGAGFVLWYYRRRIPGIAMFGVMLFVALLVPVLGFATYGNMAVTFVSDHYLYFACIGPFLIAAYALHRLAEAQQAFSTPVKFLTGTTLVVLAAKTMLYTPVFKNASAMWNHTLAGNPNCYPAMAGLGREAEFAGDWPTAIERYRQAHEIMPELPDAKYDLGRALYEVRALDEAEVILRELREMLPRFAPGLLKLGQVTQWNNRLADSIGFLKESIAIDPTNAEAQYELAESYRKSGRYPLGATHAEKAVELQPNYGWAFWTHGVCVRELGDFKKARRIFEAGLASAPNDLYLPSALSRLMSTCPDASVRDGRAAIEMANLAIKSNRGANPDRLDTLAAALAEAGRFEEAVKFAQQGIAMAQATGDTQTSARIAKHIELFKKQTPLREGASDSDEPE